METDDEHYSSLDWALTADPTQALFPGSWGPPQESWPDPDPELDLLLSASFYPFPDVDDSLFQNVDHEYIPDGQVASTSAEHPTPTKRSPPRAVKKRGRPRKTPNAGVSPEEVRHFPMDLEQGLIKP